MRTVREQAYEGRQIGFGLTKLPTTESDACSTQADPTGPSTVNPTLKRGESQVDIHESKALHKKVRLFFADESAVDFDAPKASGIVDFCQALNVALQ